MAFFERKMELKNALLKHLSYPYFHMLLQLQPTDFFKEKNKQSNSGFDLKNCT